MLVVVASSPGRATALPGCRGAGDVDPSSGAVLAVPEAECARLTVPLDDTNPADGRTIDLALDRVCAPASPIGASGRCS